MQEPTWANVRYPRIDFQDLYYYSAPKSTEGPKSLAEVDPELLETYAKLGIPLKEQAVLAGVDVPDPARGTFDEHSGFGDMSLTSFLSPEKTNGFLWGVGPSFIFPTARSTALGAGKWQAGPAALGLYMGKEWIAGGLVNQWWSFAGQDNRPDTSAMNFQYFLFYLIPGGWQVGMSPDIQVNWKAEPGNKLTLPIGFGAGKLFKLGKLPVKLTLEVDYALVKPEDYGQRWTIRFQLIPVIPALVQDVLFK
jgi:hypothetical protein